MKFKESKLWNSRRGFKPQNPYPPCVRLCVHHLVNETAFIKDFPTQRWRHLRVEPYLDFSLTDSDINVQGFCKPISLPSRWTDAACCNCEGKWHRRDLLNLREWVCSSLQKLRRAGALAALKIRRLIRHFGGSLLLHARLSGFREFGCRLMAWSA